ncbi:FAD-dependent oxidoreductase [Falsiroseomonas bella]|uniref:FAD-dependent oxidoreductase n=1 Tax=Falsiroseomonas bella TaxID=2184016 RepID=A0A317FG35_9PROT|nr:FAD-dependent oxidoreductase [Falsiroseomonas bella]PWS38040.1 FAD-dependent oxidoreductase [Falsiroseomonas bella]
MPSTYQNPRYPPAPTPQGAQHRPVVIAGAGLVGLTLALDLARHGVAVTVLDEDDTVSFGSRAICFAKRTLEIFGRLGLGARFTQKGITWKTGRVFHGDREAYAFDLLPEEGHEYPAFVNLQQYYAEEWLVEACLAAGVEIRWKHRITRIAPDAVGATVIVDTPDGGYALHADWLLACDGARSFIRESMGLPFTGQVFRDRFLIADVVIKGDVQFPTERWFWFDPPFHPGQSVLLHKQPDDVWRIDFQLGWDADPEEEKRPEKVIPRVRAMLGEHVPFDLEWVSVYTFRCRRIERFRHGRVIFAGDAAHQVSPFGARGGNAGVQDADNLAWKLAAVLAGRAPEALLDSYDAERIPATDENILNSTRSTDFITPKNEAARGYRDAVLELAAHHAFARPLVNSGRLSRPSTYAASPLNGPAGWEGGAPPGAPAPDAPVLQAGRPDWLLRHLGDGFRLLVFGAPDAALVAALPAGVAAVFVTAEETPGALFDHAGLAASRFAAPRGGAVLIRPDQHVAARFALPDPAAIVSALERALCRYPAEAAA